MASTVTPEVDAPRTQKWARDLALGDWIAGNQVNDRQGMRIVGVRSVVASHEYTGHTGQRELLLVLGVDQEPPTVTVLSMDQRVLMATAVEIAAEKEAQRRDAAADQLNRLATLIYHNQLPVPQQYVSIPVTFDLPDVDAVRAAGKLLGIEPRQILNHLVVDWPSLDNCGWAEGPVAARWRAFLPEEPRAAVPAREVETRRIQLPVSAPPAPSEYLEREPEEILPPSAVPAGVAGLQTPARGAELAEVHPATDGSCE